MNVTLQLTPEVEQKLRLKAAHSSQTLEQYLQRLAEHQAELEPLPTPGDKRPEELSADEWVTQWRAWCANFPQKGGPLIDDSRESIYEGRDE